MVNDMCADILSQSALKNNANNIMAIFLNKAKIGEMLATPPTDAQNRLLTALQMRSNIDATELYSLFPAFFGNYQAMRVLQDIGEKNGVKIALLLFAGIWQTV